MTAKRSDKELEALAIQIKHDQASSKPAEKRVSVKTTFGNAVKKMGRTPAPKKDSK